MVPLRLFADRAFAIGNATTFFMSGAMFATAFFVTQEFQFARGYSPLSTGLRLLPFFATPHVHPAVAGALSDRIGRRPMMVVGLILQTVGFIWVAAHGAPEHQLDRAGRRAARRRHRRLDGAADRPDRRPQRRLPEEIGKASGINAMFQRFGTVFAMAIAGAVFSAYGHLGTPEGVTAGFRAGALGLCRVRRDRWPTVSAAGMTSRTPATVTHPEGAELSIADVERASGTKLRTASCQRRPAGRLVRTSDQPRLMPPGLMPQLCQRPCLPAVGARPRRPSARARRQYRLGVLAEQRRAPGGLAPGPR